MLLSLNRVRSFVTKRPAAEKALSDSTDVGGTDRMASFNKSIFFVRSAVISNISNSLLICFLSEWDDEGSMFCLISCSNFSERDNSELSISSLLASKSGSGSVGSSGELKSLENSFLLAEITADLLTKGTASHHDVLSIS